ncbi:hypothetical protein H8356DRAFT_1364897 [Neocallimastix lanati (nom. inval.)]|nr:hypothetical protein H8356DRAFT_1364897 [Neocallimastix sp. JGI-2020a]
MTLNNNNTTITIIKLISEDCQACFSCCDDKKVSNKLLTNVKPIVISVFTLWFYILLDLPLSKSIDVETICKQYYLCSKINKKYGKNLVSLVDLLSYSLIDKVKKPSTTKRVNSLVAFTLSTL